MSGPPWLWLAIWMPTHINAPTCMGHREDKAGVSRRSVGLDHTHHEAPVSLPFEPCVQKQQAAHIPACDMAL